MRYIRYGMATILVAGMASLAYARGPAPSATPASPELTTGYAPAAQQDEPKANKTQEAKPPRADKPMAHPMHQEKANKNQQKKEEKRDKAQSKEEQKDHKAAGKNARIPDKDLKAHFGHQHRFAAKQVITTRTIVPNQTRFVYSGYTFVFLEPWPVGWGWDDDVYIDYINGGYYLLDPFHPGVQVGLSIGF